MMTTAKTNKGENLFPRLWSDFFDTERFPATRWFEREQKNSLPAVNIKESATQFSVEFAAPGFKKSDFKINVEGTLLTVEAEKSEEKNEKNERFTRKEFSYNSFERSFTLPQSVNGEKIDAKYSDGILSLTIPKKDVSKENPKKEIKIN